MDNIRTAILGGGCFWCLEALFKRVEGVVSVVSGYAGGSVPEPDYRQVCSGTTGHAEVVSIRFNPESVTYRELLLYFFRIHDPTTPNRQGADVGTQYRSIVLTSNEEEEAVARSVIELLDGSGQFAGPVVSEIVKLDRFYPAEEYHQDYFARNPDSGYCRAVIAPKLKLLEDG